MCLFVCIIFQFVDMIMSCFSGKKEQWMCFVKDSGKKDECILNSHWPASL